MNSGRPETLEACWSLIEMMDREVVGAQDDLAKANEEIRRLRHLLGADNDVYVCPDCSRRFAQGGLDRVEGSYHCPYDGHGIDERNILR